MILLEQNILANIKVINLQASGQNPGYLCSTKGIADYHIKVHQKWKIGLKRSRKGPDMFRMFIYIYKYDALLMPTKKMNK